jgi:hypothetical protein
LDKFFRKPVNTLDAYYRLIESYRNEKDRVCHRTLLNAGFPDDPVTADRLNQVRRILCNRREEAFGHIQLFEIGKDNDNIVNELADEFWHRPVSENRIDVGQKPKLAQEISANPCPKTNRRRWNAPKRCCPQRPSPATDGTQQAS